MIFYTFRLIFASQSYAFGSCEGTLLSDHLYVSGKSSKLRETSK